MLVIVRYICLMLHPLCVCPTIQNPKLGLGQLTIANISPVAFAKGINQLDHSLIVVLSIVMLSVFDTTNIFPKLLTSNSSSSLIDKKYLYIIISLFSVKFLIFPLLSFTSSISNHVSSNLKHDTTFQKGNYICSLLSIVISVIHVCVCAYNTPTCFKIFIFCFPPSSKKKEVQNLV